MACTVDVPPGADANEFMVSRGWSDGLPLVPPTSARVEKMLCGTASARTRVLGQCAPMFGEVTVEKVAINAVMAGCEPRQFRIVLAAVEALLRPEFNIHGVGATTMGATPALIVSGPCRHQAGLNMGTGALGSGSRATCIGRALKLVLQNVGGAVLGGTESTTLGSPSKFGLVLAEAEEQAPLWEPVHVSRGVAAHRSAVTVHAVTGGPQQLVDFATRDALTLCTLMAASLATMYAATLPLVNEVVVVVSPEHYATLVRGGIKSKAQLQLALFYLTSLQMGSHVRHHPPSGPLPPAPPSTRAPARAHLCLCLCLSSRRPWASSSASWPPWTQ